MMCIRTKEVPFISEYKVEDDAEDGEKNTHAGQNRHNSKQSRVNRSQCVSRYTS